ncbi:MgtC/SapB family protein [Paenibacillus thermoaerophilus]|uniref:MgtC/SapB family protein n=1 Tax=Paenibacillus thermoaerophilus TaxID=1215385 RepID=A0ABW2V4D2_9BACL|nr:MgtC/SapB family protein [Paenibacillus thermoaerophilus]TMV16101.1 MgtC/SapB family protein [Paenibacillus thermoaerophilus]
MNPWVISPFDVTIRLVVAIALGGLVGWEREHNNHAAGFRTHILVCLGSTLIMLLSIYGFSDFVNEPSVQTDPARLAANVITGIGFLGAGTILYNGMSITGLTTAASLWVVAAIGLAVGAGFYYPAAVTTVSVLVCLWFLNKVEHRWMKAKRIHRLRLVATDSPGLLTALSEAMSRSGVELRQLTAAELEERSAAEGRSLVKITLTVKLLKPKQLYRLLDELRERSDVIEVESD